MSSQKILIKNGTVVHSDKVEVTDVLIEDQIIERIENNICVSVDREIDAANKLVLINKDTKKTVIFFIQFKYRFLIKLLCDR